MVNRQVRYYKGKDIKNSYQCMYDIEWDLSAVPEWKDNLEDDVLYTVKEDFQYYESCGIMGDIEGERHNVIYIEKTPDKILDIIEKLKSLRDEQREYEQRL